MTIARPISTMKETFQGGLEMRNMNTTKISKGVYEYKGYRVSNCGYHQPDHCVWWEGINLETGCADYHATTKKRIIEMIDEKIKD